MSFTESNSKNTDSMTRIGVRYWVAVTFAMMMFMSGSWLIFAYYTNLAYKFGMTTTARIVGVLCLLLGFGMLVAGYRVIMKNFRELLHRLACQHAEKVAELSKPPLNWVK